MGLGWGSQKGDVKRDGTTGEEEAALGTTGSSQRMKTSPTPARNDSIQEGP